MLLEIMEVRNNAEFFQWLCQNNCPNHVDEDGRYIFTIELHCAKVSFYAVKDGEGTYHYDGLFRGFGREATG